MSGVASILVGCRRAPTSVKALPALLLSILLVGPACHRDTLAPRAQDTCTQDDCRFENCRGCAAYCTTARAAATTSASVSPPPPPSAPPSAAVAPPSDAVASPLEVAPPHGYLERLADGTCLWNYSAYCCPPGALCKPTEPARPVACPPLGEVRDGRPTTEVDVYEEKRADGRCWTGPNPTKLRRTLCCNEGLRGDAP